MRGRCLLVNGNSSQDSIKRVLLSLKAQIGRIELNIGQRGTLQLSTQEAAENERLARNLSRLARMANDFHSNASIAIEGDRSTVWGGSIMGDPLSNEQYRRIHGWIPPVVFEQNENPKLWEENLDPVPGKGPPGPGYETDSDSDSDSDVEKDLMDHFESLGINEFRNKNWLRAEVYLRKVVTREKPRLRPRTMPLIETMLACSCMLNNKWDDGELFILPYTKGKAMHNVLLYYSLYGLAVFKANEGDWETALRYCLQAVNGIRIAKGQNGMPYQVSLLFLSYIHGALGNEEEKEGFLSFVQDEYLIPPFEVDPAVALVNILNTLPDRITLTKNSRPIDDENESKFLTSRRITGASTGIEVNAYPTARVDNRPEVEPNLSTQDGKSFPIPHCGAKRGPHVLYSTPCLLLSSNY